MSTYEDNLWNETKSENPMERAQALRQLGGFKYSNSDFATALNCADTAADLFKTIGDAFGEGDSLYTSARAQLELKRPVEALAALERASEIFRAHSNELFIAACTVRQAEAYEQLKQFELAAVSYRESAKLYANSSNKKSAGVTFMSLGDLQIKQHEYLAAIDAFEEARTLFRDVDMPLGIARVCDRIADAYAPLRFADKTIASLEEALALYNYVEDLTGIANAKYRLGWALVEFNRAFEALAYLESAKAVFKEAGLFLEAADCDFELAVAATAMGDFDHGQELFKTVRVIFSAYGKDERVLQVDLMLADNLVKSDNPILAHELLVSVLPRVQNGQDQNLVRFVVLRLAKVLIALARAGEVFEVLKPHPVETWGAAAEAQIEPMNILARANLLTENYGLAEGLSRQVIAIDPASGNSLVGAYSFETLARALAGQGEIDSSRDAMAKAIAINLACGEANRARELALNFLGEVELVSESSSLRVHQTEMPEAHTDLYDGLAVDDDTEDADESEG